MTRVISYRFCSNEIGTHAFGTREQAEAFLRAFARARDLDVHIHPGSLADGSCALSVAYTRGGDPLYDLRAIVKAVDYTLTSDGQLVQQR